MTWMNITNIILLIERSKMQNNIYWIFPFYEAQKQEKN